MKHQFYSLLIVLSIFASCSSISKTETSKKNIQSQQLDSLFNFCHSNGMFNGAILVAKHDSIIYKKSFGFTNEETKKKITPESVFYIASVSKQFTAMGIMILQEQGKLSYDDKINDFFPNYPEYLKNITVRQLLNHTSGITDKEYYKLTNPSNKDVLDMLLKQDSLELENGKTFRYSNAGYVMLALIIQKISGKPIDQFFNQEIFEPLKMQNTTATKTAVEKISTKVDGYNLIGSKVDYTSSVIGPGGIYSTLNDIEKWNKALNSNKLISKKTLNEAFKNGKLNKDSITINMNGQEYGYGFGWMPYNKNEKEYVQHDGFVESYRSLIKKNLTDGYDYIFLTNQGAKLAMNELTKSIDMILDQSKYQKPKIPVINKILSELNLNGSSDLASNVKNKIDKNPTDYIYDEISINELAYTFLRDNQPKTAIEVFKLNTELNPNSANTFDSLAEGYFSNKQFKLSTENYQKSIELNPENKNAKVMIERIGKITVENN
ncbi:serine hydrolase [Flavobacterium sp. '19STA2R22 D10 B1']|uniref:serine hydrolase n=1 Tax=Flavobacterium aerium TaxID=3037261 RepID=UPI00278C8456|nr:serine hydrolase [Flavobacterium sp. '19STA2R22 D10 B1']